MALLEPKGAIATSEKSLILTAASLMLLVVIPVIVLALAFAWHYREPNSKATYRPNWAYSHRIELICWAIPCAIILVLGTIAWKTTHELDPFEPVLFTAVLDKYMDKSSGLKLAGKFCLSTTKVVAEVAQ